MQRKEFTMQDDDMEVWELEPLAAESKGVWGQNPQRLTIFTIF